MDDRQKEHQVGSERAFVGRERELAELRTGLADVTSGRRRVGGMFLISGEPGIGKTRLADELAGEAASRGMRVVWGRCWEGGGAPAYWPWIQVIRGCLNSANLDERRSVLESEHASSMVEAVAQIVPELHALAPRALRPAITLRPDPPQTQFRLFDSVATLLKNFARLQPLIVLLDDLHDADYASLMMLRLIAQGLAGAGILIVGTHRDLEVRRSPELNKHIGDLSREARCIPLTGLSQAEVAQFVVLSSGQTPDDKLAAGLHAATAGNPLFVDGVVRVLIADRAAGLETASHHHFQVPDTLREAIRRRLAVLSDEAHSLLKVAAAIGNEFEAELCLRVGEVSRDESNLRLDEATTSGITISLGNSRYRFAHALVRAGVYDALDTNTRTRLHGRIADTIEEIHAKDLAAHLGELAHHCRMAGTAANTEKTVDYSIRAGDAACRVFAYEEAATHWQAALELMDEHGGGDVWLRASLLWRLGDEIISGGTKAVKYLEAAAPLCEELGAEMLATEVHSRLALYLSAGNLGVMDMRLAMEHFKKAEALLAAQTESWRHGSFYIAMASACWWAKRIPDGLVAARHSMEIGERLGGMLQAYGENTLSMFLVVSGSVTEGLRLANRARQRADPINDAMLGSTLAWWEGRNYLLLRDPREAQECYRRELAKPRTAQSAIRRALLLNHLSTAYIETGELGKARSCLAEANVAETDAESWYWRLYFFEGDWERADRMLAGWSERSRASGNRFEDSLSGAAIAHLRRLSGEQAQAVHFLGRALDISVEGGDILQELVARSALATMAADPGDALAHLQRCRDIVGAGQDWRGLAGLAERAEGVLAASQGRSFAAHFEKSIATFKRYCLPWEEADTLYHWGRALSAAGEYSRANEKFEGAIAIYRRHSAGQRWIDRVEAAKASMPDSRGSAIFKQEGDFWTITHGGNTFRLRHFKGLTYIAYLLAHPGVRIHVFDLVAMVEGGATRAPVALAQARVDGLEASRDLGDAGEALDPQAIAEYRMRLAEVREEIAEAETNNDPGALGRARHEFDLLSNQLTAGVGRGGRARRNSSHVERARAQVTKSIRESVAHIRRNDAKLGDHFATSIRTGAFCAYLPDLANLADLKHDPS